MTPHVLAVGDPVTVNGHRGPGKVVSIAPTGTVALVDLPCCGEQFVCMTAIWPALPEGATQTSVQVGGCV